MYFLPFDLSISSGVLTWLKVNTLHCTLMSADILWTSDFCFCFFHAY